MLATDPTEEVPTDDCWGALTEKFDKSQVAWVIDSGATRHMTYSRDVFTEFIKLKVPRVVKTASGALIHGTGIGKVSIQVFIDKVQTQTLALSEVLYVPQLAGNLISVPQLQDKGILVQTTSNSSKHAMSLTKDSSVIAKAGRVSS